MRKMLVLTVATLLIFCQAVFAAAIPRALQGAVPFTISVTIIKDYDSAGQIIHWGDGGESESTGTNTYYQLYHTYDEPGVYAVTTPTSRYYVTATTDIRGPFVTNDLAIIDVDDVKKVEGYQLELDKTYYFRNNHNSPFSYMFYNSKHINTTLKKYVVFQTWSANAESMTKGASVRVSTIVNGNPNLQGTVYGKSGKCVDSDDETGTFGYIVIESSKIAKSFEVATQYDLGITLTFSKGVTGFRYYTVDSLSEIRLDPYEVRGEHTVQNKYLEFKKLGEDLEVRFKTDGYRDYVDVYLALVDSDGGITFYKYEDGDISASHDLVPFKGNTLSATNGIKEIILRAPSYCFPKGTSYVVYLAVPAGTDITSSPLTDYTLEVLEINN